MYLLVKIKSAHGMKFSIFKIYFPLLASTMIYKGKTYKNLNILETKRDIMMKEAFLIFLKGFQRENNKKNNRHFELYFIYFDIIKHQQPKKKVELFFQ